MSNKKKLLNIWIFIYNFFFLFCLFLRNDFDNKFIFFLYILIICISTDIGGYIFGKIFKGPKLTKISPNKTYSGVIGGYLLSIIFISFFLNI